MSHSVVQLFETSPLLEDALTLALDNQMSLSDCVYLALAIERKLPTRHRRPTALPGTFAAPSGDSAAALNFGVRPVPLDRRLL